MIGSTLDYSMENWKRILEVNLSGTFCCCKTAGGIIIEQSQGSIINIASVCGHVVSFLNYAPVYKARNRVKVFIEGAPVTQSLADEIGADYYSIDAAHGIDQLNSIFA